MRKPSWTRVASTRGTTTGRAILSIIALGGGVPALVATFTIGTGSWTKFIWSVVYIFVAWRFFRLGLYTSDWGVRICNPVLTWWYPWRRIDHFELGSTGEMFAPKAQAIVLVSARGGRRPALGLATSMMFFRLSEADQAEVLADLNTRLARAATSAAARSAG